ncbi:sugar phosphate isomerase/epimerase family protein [Bounagaea algeriensis]
MNELGCSSITFRNQALPDALAEIAGLGFTGIDLGGLPGVCDHVPTPAGPHAERLAEAVDAAGLDVWAINVDPGPLNDPDLSADELTRSGHDLVRLAARLDTAMIVPCGAASHEPFTDEATDLARTAERLRLLGALAAESGVRLLVEGLHHHRFCHTAARLRGLLQRVPAEVAGLVYDVSHVVAGGIDEVALARELAERVAHVHLRDAAPGDINVSIGRGRADFAGVLDALTEHGYTGRYVLELETHDVAEHERSTAAAKARDTIAALLPA